MRRCRMVLASIGLMGLCSGLGGSAAGAAGPASLADRISTMIQDSMRYPQYLGTLQPEQGSVLVAFVVGASGRAEDITVVQGSGHRRLDEAAIRCVRSLDRLPAEAAGRHSIAVLEYRVDTDEAAADRQLRATIRRLQKTWPDALVPARYLR